MYSGFEFSYLDQKLDNYLRNPSHILYDIRMNRKNCKRCRTEKVLDQFPKNKAKKDGHGYTCSACMSEIHRDYYKNSEKRRNDHKVNFERFVEKNRDIIWNHLAQNPCVDCGYDNPLALHFDHINDDKYMDVSNMARRYGAEAISAEIAKCEVRCANCHSIVTAERAGFWKVERLNDALRTSGKLPAS